METNSNQIAVTQEVAKLNFQMEAIRLNYQQILSEIESIVFTPENINEDQLKLARDLAVSLTKKKDADKRPLLDSCESIQVAYNTFYKPLDEVIKRKSAEKTAVVKAIETENRLKEQERERKVTIRKQMDGFILDTTNRIQQVKTDKELVDIEHRIGLAKGRSQSAYQEYAEEFGGKCDALRPLIKDQKDRIRQLDKLVAVMKNATENGEDHLAVEAKEEAELLQAQVEDGRIKIQEAAFEQVASMQEVHIPETTIIPKGRKLPWKFRVDDIDLMAKKIPSFVKMIIDEEKVKEYMKEMKDNWELADKSEVTVHGITFYQDKKYN